MRKLALFFIDEKTRAVFVDACVWVRNHACVPLVMSMEHTHKCMHTHIDRALCARMCTPINMVAR